MSNYFLEDAHASEYMLNLNDRKFRLAVTIEDYYSPRQLKVDPKYVKWIFRIYGKRNNVWYQELLPYHKCTDEDFAEFYPPEVNSAAKLKSIKEDPERGFLCLDWNDEKPFEIGGRETDINYTRLDIVMSPCNYLHTMLEYKDDTVSPDCITDLES